ncbi:hypothetical protein B0T10DRAFT_414803 [Thelonectria olida]|uniref:Uncharacterized protein n=1 Tax=Thelonectria olida TaxID=1576542 RepID=A0A9P8VSN6_9HYPO|nr:hypothetical protein B0T10DRAFT_414803 [Thelonectria olida]
MAAWLSSEAFLPSGAFDVDMNPPFSANLPYRRTSPSPTATPSSSFPPSMNHQNMLPYLNRQHQHVQPGRIPPASSFPINPNDSVPLSLSSLRAAQSTSQKSPPSHLRVDASTYNQTNRLSPSQSVPVSAPERGLPPSSTSPISSIPQYLAGASLSRSVSADAAPPTQQTSVYMVQRLVQQNSLIREAWEAERNYLEANRRRAEEVYQEDRAIMDDVRQVWETEKTSMLREIEGLKERLYRLEGENSTLKSIAVQVTGMVSPIGSQRGCSGDASMESSYFSTLPSQLTSRSQNPSFPNSFTITDPSSLSLGLDGEPRRLHFLSPTSSRMSPTGPPIHAGPLDPRTQPEKSIDKDFLSSPSEESFGPIPIIDVQEIDPKLEGIPIKATAVQKPTFGDEREHAETPPSPTTSPPTDVAHNMDMSQKISIQGPSSGDNTPVVLSDAESQRLTMHAGHTPCHSLSIVPTKSGTETSSIRGPSDAATPSAETTENTSLNTVGETYFDDQPRGNEIWQDGHQDHPVALLNAKEDKPLKGPLMIKNIPAQDEIFWEAVNEKLKPISQGQDALPAVMRNSPESSEFNLDPEEFDAPELILPKSIDPVGGDGSNHAHAESEDDDCETPGKTVEADIPLKFKSTSNFGAPFGAF